MRRLAFELNWEASTFLSSLHYCSTLADLSVFWPLNALIIPLSHLFFLLSFLSHLSEAPPLSLCSDRKLYPASGQRNLIFLKTPKTYYLYLFLALNAWYVLVPTVFLPFSHPLLLLQCLKTSLKCCLLCEASHLASVRRTLSSEFAWVEDLIFLFIFFFLVFPLWSVCVLFLISPKRS